MRTTGTSRGAGGHRSGIEVGQTLRSSRGSIWTIVASMVAGAALLIFIMYASVIGGCGQPKYWHVAGSGDTGATYNILFVGDGFTTEDELRTYRRAVEDLTAGFLVDPVYCQYEGALNFFRVDVRSTGGVNGASCPDGTGVVCGLKTLAAPPPGDAATLPVFKNRLGLDVVETELESRLCYTSTTPPGDCRILWMSTAGQAEALQLALDGPDINLVVVLANTWNTSGSGQQGALVSGATLVDLVAMGVPSDTTGVATDGAVTLLAHETGHALGLLDEYEDALGSLPTYANDRNVYKPSNPCWLPATGAPPSDLPWLSELDCPTEPFRLTCECDPYDPPADCFQLWEPSTSATSHDCCATWVASGITVPSATACSGSSMLPCGGGYSSAVSNRCTEFPGVWEGAFYSETGYFRASIDCTMRDSASHFCGACELAISNTLTPYGTPVACKP